MYLKMTKKAAKSVLARPSWYSEDTVMRAQEILGQISLPGCDRVRAPVPVKQLPVQRTCDLGLFSDDSKQLDLVVASRAPKAVRVDDDEWPRSKLDVKLIEHTKRDDDGRCQFTLLWWHDGHKKAQVFYSDPEAMRQRLRSTIREKR